MVNPPSYRRASRCTAVERARAPSSARRAGLFQPSPQGRGRDSRVSRPGAPSRPPPPRRAVPAPSRRAGMETPPASPPDFLKEAGSASPARLPPAAVSAASAVRLAAVSPVPASRLAEGPSSAVREPVPSPAGPWASSFCREAAKARTSVPSSLRGENPAPMPPSLLGENPAPMPPPFRAGNSASSPEIPSQGPTGVSQAPASPAGRRAFSAAKTVSQAPGAPTRGPPASAPSFAAYRPAL